MLMKYSISENFAYLEWFFFKFLGPFWNIKIRWIMDKLLDGNFEIVD